MKPAFARRTVLRGAAGCALAAAAGESLRPARAQILPAARVNGVPIPAERVDRQYEELLRERRIHLARMNNPAQAKSIKREALDQLIRVELLHQEGSANGIAVSDAELDRVLTEFRAGFRNPEAYRRRIETLGYDEPGWRAQLRKTLVGDRYAERIVEREVKVSDEDIAGFYELNARLFKRDEQLRARHILVAVPPNASAEAREEARRKIEGLATRVRAGESFDELARWHSDDPTRQWGGELDAFGRGAMPRPFEEAAFALKPGEVSAPVATPKGWHLIKLEERLAASTVPLEAARERIRGHLRTTRGKEAIEREVEQLRALGKVEVLMPL
jgi:parvulin-like peptidyl-prolyl isomerase